MKVMVTGSGGQLARELLDRAPKGFEVKAYSSTALDIRDGVAVGDMVSRERPSIIINAAAFTAVDRAESEAAHAWSVNRDGAAHLAEAAQTLGARMIQVSTDFVFDGEGGRAYCPDDEARPLNVYGASKLAGESAVAAAAPGALIVRTAWLYSPHRSNFLKTMLRLMADQGEVRVVADQIGAPTSAANLADALWGLIRVGAQGIYHVTDGGVASWYDFAHAIAEEAQALRMLGKAIRVTPILTADYPTPAPRPPFSVLDTSRTSALLGAPPPHWRVALRGVLRRLKSLA